MAVDFNVKPTRGTIYEFFPEEIEVREELNGRQEKPDIEWLITDILYQGQIQPSGIWSDAGSPVLSYGFSRWRAISEINKRKLTPEPMKLKCSYYKTNEQGAFIRNISENRMRNDTTPVDDAHNIQRLLAWGMLESAVARIYWPVAATEGEIAKAVKWVNDRLNLIKLTPESEQALKSGRMNESAAQAISKLKSTQQKAILKSKPDGPITAKDVKSFGATPKPIKYKNDPEIMRRLTLLFESADFENYDEGIHSMIEVDAVTLVGLKNYVLGE
jgi:hypothetical protein